MAYRNQLKISSKDNKEFILCSIQKKKLVFSPEEFVRQLCIQWLTKSCHVSLDRISVEKKLNNQSKRYDLVVFQSNGAPSCVIECKSFLVNLSEAAINQISVYNMTLKAPYSMITNGIQAYAFHHDEEVKELDEKELKNCLF